MKRWKSVAVAAVAFPLAVLAADTAGKRVMAPAVGAGQPKALATTATSDVVERGRLLVTAGGCNDCHTPYKFDPQLKMPVPDMSRFLSGHPEGAPDPTGTLGPQDVALIGPTFTSFKLQFGTVYVANITSDKETGIGSWNEEMFIRALRTGKHLGGVGRTILPPMPWMNLAQLPDSELKAIFAFLQTTRPIHNKVPDPKVPKEALDNVTRSFEQVRKQLQQHNPPAPR